MAEFAYFKGKLKVDPSHLNECISLLKRTELVGGDDLQVLPDGDNSIVLDAGGGYHSLTSVEGFNKTLIRCLPYITEDSLVEHFVYNEGYYQILLQPNAKTIQKRKISDKDPYSNVVSEEEFLEKLALNLSLDKASVQKFYEEYIKTIKQLLLDQKRVETALGQFGIKSFSREERMARNPQSGEEIKIPAKTFFKIVLSGNNIKE